MTTLLRTSLVTLLAALCSMPALASGEIHYIGFNRFVADHEAQSSVTFDEYLGKLRPIMDRYGMTVEAYDVLHGGSDQLSANVVTFGTAKDQESFQAFFSDAEFQQVFPMLIGALSEHQVVFTSGPFAIDSEHHGNTLLSMSWFDGDQVEGIAKINTLNAQASAVFDTYGVQQLAQSTGVLSSRGLAADVVEAEAPQHLELWSIRDAHGFFDDPVVTATNEDTLKLVSRSESFWLRYRVIR